MQSCTLDSGPPTLKLVGWNSHRMLRSSAGTSTPRGMKQEPLESAMLLSGRCGAAVGDGAGGGGELGAVPVGPRRAATLRC